MSTTRKSKESQRKLNFEVQGNDVVVDNEQTRQQRASNNMHSAPNMPASTRCTKRPKSMDSFLSPKRIDKSTAVVTPAECVRKEIPIASQDISAEYVPIYIHKNVEYISKGHTANLSPRTLKVFQWIQEHYNIPKDIEQIRTYGPLSGSSYEDRVITAYRLGKLTALGGIVDAVICTACAELGHVRDACPTLL